MFIEEDIIDFYAENVIIDFQDKPDIKIKNNIIDNIDIEMEEDINNFYEENKEKNNYNIIDYNDIINNYYSYETIFKNISEKNKNCFDLTTKFLYNIDLLNKLINELTTFDTNLLYEENKTIVFQKKIENIFLKTDKKLCSLNLLKIKNYQLKIKKLLDKLEKINMIYKKISFENYYIMYKLKTNNNYQSSNNKIIKNKMKKFEKKYDFIKIILNINKNIIDNKL